MQIQKGLALRNGKKGMADETRLQMQKQRA